MKKNIFRATTLIVVLSMMLSNLSIVGTIPVSAQSNSRNSNGSLVRQETVEPSMDEAPTEEPTEIPAPTEVTPPTDVPIPAVTEIPPLPLVTEVVEPSATPESTATEAVIVPTIQEEPSATPTMESTSVTPTTEFTFTPTVTMTATPTQIMASIMGDFTGTITGTVTKATDHTPLSGISVCVENYDSGQGLGCFNTNSSGVYTATNLPDGDFRVSVFNDGYVWQFYNNTLDNRSASRVTVSGGAPRSGIDFSLSPAGVISGRVVGPDGTTPIENINVELSGDGFGNGTCTNSNGNYTFSTVPFNTDFRVQVARADGTNFCKNGAANEYSQQFWQNAADWDSAAVITLLPENATATKLLSPKGDRFVGRMKFD